MEQLTEGTAVTFVVERVDGGKTIAKRVRLAPVGSRVRLTQLETGIRIGQISDPANAHSKGVVRFISAKGALEHLLYNTADVQQQPQQPTMRRSPMPNKSPGPPATAQPPTPAPPAQADGALALPAAPAHHTAPVAGGPPPPATTDSATQPTSPPYPRADPHHRHQPHPASQLAPHPPPVAGLAKGQLVLFRIATDMRAALMAREAAARGSPPARAIAFQRAVELRPVDSGELDARPQLRRQAELLVLLEAGLQASKAAKAAGGAKLDRQPR